MFLSYKYTKLTFAILGLVLIGSPGNAAEDDPAEVESTPEVSVPDLPQDSTKEKKLDLSEDFENPFSEPSVSPKSPKEEGYDLSKVFKNDFSEVLKPETEPQITIAIQRFQTIPGGATQSYTQHQTVDWTSGISRRSSVWASSCMSVKNRFGNCGKNSSRIVLRMTRKQTKTI